MSPKESTPAKARIGAELLSLWEKSTPINYAPFRFGEAALVKRHRAIAPKGGFLGGMANLIATLGGKPEAVRPELRETPEQWSEYTDLTHQIEDGFRARLLNGEFVVLGFVPPRHPDDFPYHVPKDLFQIGCLNFDNGKASGQGLRFEAVRVMPKNSIETLPPSKSPPGRPSKRATIRAAYAACVAERLIDFEAPQLRAIECVQLWIETHRRAEFGDGRGFGPEAIRNVIAKEFAALAPKHRRKL